MAFNSFRGSASFGASPYGSPPYVTSYNTPGNAFQAAPPGYSEVELTRWANQISSMLTTMQTQRDAYIGIRRDDLSQLKDWLESQLARVEAHTPPEIRDVLRGLKKKLSTVLDESPSGGGLAPQFNNAQPYYPALSTMQVHPNAQNYYTVRPNPNPEPKTTTYNIGFGKLIPLKARVEITRE